MSLDQLWQTYHSQGYNATKAIPVSSAIESFYLSVLAFGEGQIDQAAEYARKAGDREPDNPVFAQALIYLKRVLKEGKQGVYSSAEAFTAFIHGGGNVPLYQETSAALRRVYQEYSKLSVLDIGAGDGRALLPALTGTIHRLDLLEPSETMLNTLCAILDDRGIHYHATCGTLQEFTTTSTGNWDIIEASYSLQSIPPKERPSMFRWIREHGKRLLLVEFDIPAFADMYAPDRVEYVVERYKNGLAEYVHEGEIVAQGFLMPVMFGYFDFTADRTNYEQPLQKWCDELNEAGFTTIESPLIYPYWWASAYLIDACYSSS